MDHMDPNCKSSCISSLPSANLADISELDDGDEHCEEVFCEERVRMKIQVLAMMVGIEGCSEPAAVLAEAVRVLRELDDRAKGVFLLSEGGIQHSFGLRERN